MPAYKEEDAISNIARKRSEEMKRLGENLTAFKLAQEQLRTPVRIGESAIKAKEAPGDIAAFKNTLDAMVKIGDSVRAYERAATNFGAGIEQGKISRAQEVFSGATAGFVGVAGGAIGVPLVNIYAMVAGGEHISLQDARDALSVSAQHLRGEKTEAYANALLAFAKFEGAFTDLLREYNAMSSAFLQGNNIAKASSEINNALAEMKNAHSEMSGAMGRFSEHLEEFRSVAAMSGIFVGELTIEVASIVAAGQALKAAKKGAEKLMKIPAVEHMLKKGGEKIGKAAYKLAESLADKSGALAATARAATRVVGTAAEELPTLARGTVGVVERVEHTVHRVEHLQKAFETEKERNDKRVEHAP